MPSGRASLMPVLVKGRAAVLSLYFFFFFFLLRYTFFFLYIYMYIVLLYFFSFLFLFRCANSLRVLFCIDSTV